MIISSFIERFKYNYRFIESFWTSLEFIASLKEKIFVKEERTNKNREETFNDIPTSVEGK